MFARFRRRGTDDGFTLVELLVVILVIGILAAIAIPIFLNQRKNAKDATAKSDLNSVATALEGYFTNNRAYVAPAQVGTTLTVGPDTVNLSPGDTVTVTFNGTAGAAGSSTAYCIEAAVTGGTQHWVYESDQGGLQASTAGSCPTVTYALNVPA